jgi:hypothetical protein
MAKKTAVDAPDPDEWKHTHYYDPAPIDRYDARPHPGSSAIAPGSPVQKMKWKMGPGRSTGGAFAHIRDQYGNNQSVFKTALASKKGFQSKMSDAQGQASSGWGGPEPKYPGYFHDRREEGRRDRPI